MSGGWSGGSWTVATNSSNISQTQSKLNMSTALSSCSSNLSQTTNSTSSWNQSFKTKTNSVDWNGLVDNVFEEEISNFVNDFNKINNSKK